MSDGIYRDDLRCMLRSVYDSPIAYSKLIFSFELSFKRGRNNKLNILRKLGYFVYDILGDGFIET
jgi:hypothetical protein